ncbi:uncharacterized protein LOC131594419 [Vicia villosa]|uniref:uncharacterized protein LOC131594419 n=1 Tax=Vicia villosa TaxID=3911 RepID=UPI00273AF320|nr:uncharacterized protein LOC131594419 [Vicia villosa]
MSNMQYFWAKSLWRSSKIGYSYSNSIGMSGGVITLWKEGSIEVEFSFKGEGYLGIKVLSKEFFYYMVNVYSPCCLRKKKLLWEKLLELKEKFSDGEWLLGGDFNAVKHRSERKGRGMFVNDSESSLFAEFIGESGLVEVPCKGKKFSWYSGDGRSMSRIDHFILSDVIVNRWNVIGQLIDDRDISDHFPIWLVLDGNNWGPKPFKFNNEWFSFNSFTSFV